LRSIGIFHGWRRTKGIRYPRVNKAIRWEDGQTLPRSSCDRKPLRDGFGKLSSIFINGHYDAIWH